MAQNNKKIELVRLSLKENPLLAAFERDSDEPVGESRWFIRVLGEEKDTFTLRFMLRQRMLHYETYVMPAPEENKELFFENLLTRNRKIVGATFCLAEEDAVCVESNVKPTLELLNCAAGIAPLVMIALPDSVCILSTFNVPIKST